MKSLLKTSLLLIALTVCASPSSVRAEDIRPDDMVMFDLAAESWVSTKSAKVTLAVEAAVSGNTAGTMRPAMAKAINDVVKADWRLTSFNRSQDSTGMERWSAFYEARIPENELNNLSENAKKNSKPGMQVTVSNIDFSPTLEETQATVAQLRAQIYKQATEQLAVLNTAMTGRTYRISMIDFTGMEGMTPMMAPMNRKGGIRTMAAMAMAGANDSMSAEMAPMERSEKLTLNARVVLATTAPTPTK